MIHDAELKMPKNPGRLAAKVASASSFIMIASLIGKVPSTLHMLFFSALPSRFGGGWAVSRFEADPARIGELVCRSDRVDRMGGACLFLANALTFQGV